MPPGMGHPQPPWAKDAAELKEAWLEN